VPPRCQAGGRVYGDAVDADFEVQVGAGGVAGRADGADRLASLNVLVVAHEDLRAVSVQRRGLATVIHDDRIAIPAFPTREDDAAGRGGGDRRAHGRADVDPRVHLELARARVHAHAERRGDRSRCGPRERARATLGGFGRRLDAREQGRPAARVGLGGAPRLFFLLALPDVRLELRFLGRRQVFELRHLARDGAALRARNGDELRALVGQRVERELRLPFLAHRRVEDRALALEAGARLRHVELRRASLAHRLLVRGDQVPDVFPALREVVERSRREQHVHVAEVAALVRIDEPALERVVVAL
jgi:hypothetical protein